MVRCVSACLAALKNQFAERNPSRYAQCDTVAFRGMPSFSTHIALGVTLPLSICKRTWCVCLLHIIRLSVIKPARLRWSGAFDYFALDFAHAALPLRIVCDAFEWFLCIVCIEFWVKYGCGEWKFCVRNRRYPYGLIGNINDFSRNSVHKYILVS